MSLMNVFKSICHFVIPQSFNDRVVDSALYCLLGNIGDAKHFDVGDKFLGSVALKILTIAYLLY